MVTSTVRHKKSKKLVFKYWNHLIEDVEPTDSSAFEYINVDYAVRACKWSKFRSMLALIAASVMAEDIHRNLRPTRKQIKRAKQKARKSKWVEMQQQPLQDDKQIALANNVTLDTTTQSFMDFYACTALDLNEDGTRLTSATSLKGPDKVLWEKAHGEEIVRLIESKTGRFIQMSEMPRDRTAAYYNPQLKIKLKPEGIQRRVRGTIGGDKVYYPGVTAAYVAHLETIRIQLNAAASEDAYICKADINDFYLGTPLDRKEYMRISLKHIPSDIQARYNIASMVHNGYVLMEISKGIYGLPQAGKLAQDRLVKHLASHN